jgi:hypothetical protein
MEALRETGLGGRATTAASPHVGINEALNRLVMQVAIRAEMLSQEVADTAFVEVHEVTDGLRRIDHQVIYGRRGAGKTHAFRNLATSVDREGGLAVYLDLRTIGSSGGLYGDTNHSLPARGTQLLIDVLEALHGQLLSKAIEDDRFDALLGHLDAILDAATQVRVEGPVSVMSEVTAATDAGDEAGWEAKAQVALTGVKADFQRKKGRKSSSRSAQTQVVQRSGQEVPRILFGRLSKAITAACQSIAPRRLWVLLDEWSSLPLDLQPLLADMLRRGLFACPGVTVKMGAIERRSSFKQRGRDSADYIGLELGADTAAALNLDELLVREDAHEQFFSELIYRHLTALLRQKFNRSFRLEDSAEMASVMFQPGALTEFVRAAEGVPRDALQIAYHAAQQAGRRPIGVLDVQNAARKFYLQDKETGIAGNPGATRVWTKLQKEVVAGRRSRSFLIKRDREKTHAGILDLYDARLIHLMQAGLGTSSEPGALYDGYCLDYGSYVHMLHEAELTAAWNSSGRPWGYRGSEAFLPDGFDERAVFLPSGPSHAVSGARSRR